MNQPTTWLFDLKILRPGFEVATSGEFLSSSLRNQDRSGFTDGNRKSIFSLKTVSILRRLRNDLIPRRRPVYSKISYRLWKVSAIERRIEMLLRDITMAGLRHLVVREPCWVQFRRKKSYEKIQRQGFKNFTWENLKWAWILWVVFSGFSECSWKQAKVQPRDPLSTSLRIYLCVIRLG